MPPYELSDMCGRNSLFIDQADLEARFDAEMVADGGYTPRYNIAPGEDLYIITDEASDEIGAYHWGLIPFWADEPEEGIINARSETADEKRVFERAWESRPCLVLSSGFYEWKSPNGGSKQPYRIHREDDPAFAMAGLWDVWEGDDETISCVTIITTEPNDLMNSIHDRYTEEVETPRTKRTIRTYLSKMEQYNLLEAKGTSRDREYSLVDSAAVSPMQ